jgi:hypothetical protein
MSRPLAREQMTAKAAAGMPAAEEGTKTVAEGSVGDSQNASARPGLPLSQGQR